MLMLQNKTIKNSIFIVLLVSTQINGAKEKKNEKEDCFKRRRLKTQKDFLP